VRAACIESESERLASSLEAAKQDLELARAQNRDLEEQLSRQRAAARSQQQGMEDAANLMRAQLDSSTTELGEQRRLTSHYRGESEAMLATLDCSATRLAMQLQQAQSDLAQREADLANATSTPHLQPDVQPFRVRTLQPITHYTISLSSTPLH
jgi:hypothetical protein